MSRQLTCHAYSKYKKSKAALFAVINAVRISKYTFFDKFKVVNFSISLNLYASSSKFHDEFTHQFITRAREVFSNDELTHYTQLKD